MALFGYFAIILGLICSLYGIAAFIIAVKKKNPALLVSAKRTTLAVAVLSSIASFVLIYFLMTRNYAIQYVSEYTSNDLPLFYRFAAWWAGNSGSILLWLFVLSWYGVAVAFSRKTKHLTPYATAIILFNATFFFFVLSFIDNPFAANPNYTPGMNGAGMNPMLQNPGMVFHPLTLYLGYVGFAVPFAYAMAALITKQADDEWIKVTRRWTLVAWMFLSLGNLWGAQWAYMELGWGGYWGWDPVENASFIPWLTGSAFLHSVMVQERKDMLKVWNVSLIAITYVLTLFGTFLVRSGVISSVHAFSNSSIGRYFLALTVFMLFASIYLIFDRRKLLTQGHDFESFLSKESSFLANNLVLVGLAFAVLWGTLFPIISEAVTGVKVTVGAPFFNSVSAPLGLALFLLMGICPLIAWRKASPKNLLNNFRWPALGAIAFGVVLFVLGTHKIYAVAAYAIAFFVIVTILLEIARGTRVRHRLVGESYPIAFVRLLIRNRRRHGGYMVHLGVVLMLIAITGSHTYDLNVTRSIKLGDSVNIGAYNLHYDKLDERQDGSKDVVYADFSVYKNGQYVGTVEPQKVFYPTAQDQPATSVGLRSTLQDDLYVILSNWQQDRGATFKVFVNPQVKWLWIGGYVLIFGTIFALWPGLGSRAGSKYISTKKVADAAR